MPPLNSHIQQQFHQVPILVSSMFVTCLLPCLLPTPMSELPHHHHHHQWWQWQSSTTHHQPPLHVHITTSPPTWMATIPPPPSTTTTQQPPTTTPTQGLRHICVSSARMFLSLFFSFCFSNDIFTISCEPWPWQWHQQQWWQPQWSPTSNHV